MPGPGLPQPAGDVPGVEGRVVGENLVIVDIFVHNVICPSCTYKYMQLTIVKYEDKLFTENRNNIVQSCSSKIKSLGRQRSYVGPG